MKTNIRIKLTVDDRHT